MTPKRAGLKINVSLTKKASDTVLPDPNSSAPTQLAGVEEKIEEVSLLDQSYDSVAFDCKLPLDLHKVSN